MVDMDEHQEKETLIRRQRELQGQGALQLPRDIKNHCDCIDTILVHS